jgi:hypothetical protein
MYEFVVCSVLCEKVEEEEFTVCRGRRRPIEREGEREKTIKNG